MYVCCLQIVVEFELLNNCPQTHLTGIVLRCPQLIHYITHTNIGFSFSAWEELSAAVFCWQILQSIREDSGEKDVCE